MSVSIPLNPERVLCRLCHQEVAEPRNDLVVSAGVTMHDSCAKRLKERQTLRADGDSR